MFDNIANDPPQGGSNITFLASGFLFTEAQNGFQCFLGNGRRRTGWPRQQISLCIANTEFHDRQQFVNRFNTFGNNLAIHRCRQIDQRFQNRNFKWIIVNVPHNRHVEFDKVRVELRDRLQTGVTGTGVVHGDTIALPPIMMQSTGKIAKVTDCRPLGDFECDLLGNQSVMQNDLFGSAVAELRVVDHFRRDIQKKLLPG